MSLNQTTSALLKSTADAAAKTKDLSKELDKFASEDDEAPMLAQMESENGPTDHAS